jgi:NAD(P)-dependent dehydrogenase (short-subunit alcohol dehydrogenase family)
LKIDKDGEGGRMGKIDGRVAIVTGAAMGNGEGIARILGHAFLQVLTPVKNIKLKS